MRWGVWVFALGGALWVLKVLFITLNDAMGRATDALPVPVFYLSAVLLMTVGATAVGIAILRRFPGGRSFLVCCCGRGVVAALHGAGWNPETGVRGRRSALVPQNWASL
jgi:hypothetical protein